MIKKFSALLSIALLFQLLATAIPVQADRDGLSVLENSAVAEFPSAINFSLTAESNADIVDVRLHYYVDRLSYARVTAEIFMDVLPGSTVSAEWSWDMRKTGGLPPGTTIYYWWSIADAQRRTLETKTESLQFNDDRFDWKMINRENVTLFWYEGDESFALELLNAASEGLDKLYESTGIDFTDPVTLYIYEDSTALQDAMIFPQTWTGGIAYPRYSTIAIGVKESNLDWGLRTVVHELTHLVIHRMTDNPYNGLPTWLDEGLAMYLEGPLTGSFTYYFNRAKENGNLFTVRSLVSPFSAYADQSYLSYAESQQIVDYLISEYGHEKMLELLLLLAEGTDYDEALLDVYSFDMDELNARWLEYLDTATEQEFSVTGLINVYPVLFPAVT